MSDLMDTNKVRTVKNTCEDGGSIVENNYTLDHNQYVVVKEKGGKVIKGNCVDQQDDTMLDW